ncbi:MAG: energy-coupling factor transporter transmembrane protein EcfT [Thermodesulfovibrionales bacterium]|nr:energy-coupling factor transporter transmembrane protein EcfT [Nitrospinota bacterium]MCG2710567.1 energy-coupling factor transporter transmembrane protein EcfT [Thermodesulfovibrionales bacterium]
MSSEFKIILYVVFIVSLFLIHDLSVYIIILIALSLLLLRIPFASLKRGWLPISLFLAFTFMSNVFFSHGKILYNLGPIVITAEGMHIATLRTLRIFFMVAGAKILTASTPLDVLVAGLGNILKPLEKTGLPLNDFFETMGLTLKCFPKLKDYLAENYRNHKNKEENRGFFGNARVISLFLLPMFIQSIQNPEVFFRENSKSEKSG